VQRTYLFYQKAAKKRARYKLSRSFIVCNLIQVIFQLTAAAWMTQFAQCLRLNLTNTLTRDMELLAHFFERAAAPIIQSEAQLQYLALSLRQTIQHILHLLLEQLMACRICRGQGSVIFNEITQVTIILFANWRFQTHRFLADLDDLAHLLRADLHLSGNFFGRGFTSKVLQQTAANADQAIDRLHHMYRNTNRARLIGNRTRNRLANPPGGIRTELVSLRVIELLHGPDQPDITLLDQVQQAHAAPDILLSHAHNQSQICLGQTPLCLFTIINQAIVAAYYRL